MERMGVNSMTNMYASGIESSRTYINESNITGKGMTVPSTPSASSAITKPAIIPYDFHADVHNQTHDFLMNVTQNEHIVHYFICYQKQYCI